MTERKQWVSMPETLWRALARVVETSRISRDTLLAEAVAAYLVSRGALAPEELTSLTPKKTPAPDT